MSDPLAIFARARSGQPMIGVGLMSGTAADGVDAAVVRISRTPSFSAALLGFVTVPYPEPLRRLLLRAFANEATTRDLCVLNCAVGEAFASAAQAALQKAGVSMEDVDFAASHGQTIWHQPNPSDGELCTRSTLQVGEAARIAERLGAPVISDFRQQDMAAGGQGAPLIPHFDFLLLSDPRKNRAVQNIGGIGNVTYLRAGGTEEEVIAFDTGPGNVWIDAAAAMATNGAHPCDLNGRLAAAAPVDRDLLKLLLADPYFQEAPPKSTGRELFSASRVRELWEQGYRGSLLVSTLTQLTVETIAEAYRRWLGPIDEVIVAGGGARNPELVRRLEHAVRPAKVLTHEEVGINSEAKEAIGFTVLGWETLRGKPSNLPSATGARRPVIQGKICLP